MVGNEWDDILYWEDYAPFAQFQRELDLKYDLKNPIEYEKRQAERDSFYRSTIPTKEEFIKRFERYALLGKAQWVQGHHRLINEFTEEELMNSFRFASDEHGLSCVALTEKARLGWAALHLPHYSAKVCDTNSSSHRIMEMTVGAGVGTNAIVRSMTSDMHYIGVDIDFVCAKNADAIGRIYQKNALGLCASLWHLPFQDNLFDVVCSHFGLDECREIPTILDEATRVLKPGGKLVSVSRHTAWLRRHEIFEKYDIDETQARNLMQQVRLYADFDQLDSLIKERGFVLTDYVPFERWYVVEYHKT